MRLIPLLARDGLVRAHAKVDDEDYRELARWSWTLSVANGAPRAERRANGRLVRMHRQIMGLKHGDRREVDHKDGDSLNNQSHNLRVTTHAQNHQNRQNGYGDRPARLRGVSYDKNRRKWKAAATLNGRTHNLGRFDTPEEAIAVVTEWRAANMTHAIEPTIGGQ